MNMDMLNKTQIGVCMDYSVAYLLEEKNDERVITIIEADVASAADVVSAEIVSQVNPNGKNHGFYKKVFELIKNFDRVSLYGPTPVRNEILNHIKTNKLLNIEILSNPVEGKITENQKIDFINAYFES